jgi:hypothetical protein
MLKQFFFLNGLYDICCGMVILKIMNVPFLQTLHLNMLQETQNEVYERFFAYWIITYGIIRLSNNYKLIGFTYLVESFVLINEYNYNNVVMERAFIVMFSSLILAKEALYLTGV